MGVGLGDSLGFCGFRVCGLWGLELGVQDLVYRA